MIDAFELDYHGIVLTAEDIADVLWLAPYITTQPVEGVEVYSRGLGFSEHQPKKTESIGVPQQFDTQPEGYDSSHAVLERAPEGIQRRTAEAVPIYLRSGEALPNKLQISRALRPFLRRESSNTAVILNEDATVEAIARGDDFALVFDAEKERWLDLVLIIDESPSMVIWHQTIQELHALFAQMGAFRFIESWGIGYEISSTSQEYNGIFLHLTSNGGRVFGRQSTPQELITSTQRRLLLVISDCSSPAWKDGSIAKWLNFWGEHNSVSLVQMLPRKYWAGTGLQQAVEVILSSTTIVNKNRGFLVDETAWYWDDSQQIQSPPIPITTLEPHDLNAWAQLLSGRGQKRVYGYCFEPTSDPTISVRQLPTQIAEPMGEDRLRFYQQRLSPPARKLAGYLSAVPLSLPIIRLVRRTLLTDTTQYHLAEIFHSGIIKRNSEKYGSTIDPDTLHYDFLDDDLRQLFLFSLGDNTKEVVLEAVSAYINAHTGLPNGFPAMLISPSIDRSRSSHEQGEIFARVAFQVLRSMGNRYSDLVKQWEENFSSRANEVPPEVIVDKPEGAKPISKHSVFEPSILRLALFKALRDWNERKADPDTLLSQLAAVQRAQADLGSDDNPATLRVATNKVLFEAMKAMEKQAPLLVNVLRQRFVNKKTLQEVANMMNFSTHQISRMQRDGIEQLADILQAQEHEIGRERARSLESVLPPPTYTRLFGVDELCQELVAMLAAPEAPWVVALVGMGGLGKTTVSDWVTRHLIQALSFSHVVWIRAGVSHTMGGQAEPPSLTYEKILNQLLAKLFPEARAPLALVDRAAKVRQALKARSHLVVIDNLEEAEDTSILLNHLKELAQPSKFLLTTRTRVAKQAAVRDVPLDELSFADSAAFMRYHAAETGVTAVAQATDADLEKVYAKVGGNPLALKIVVNVLDILPLNRVLDGLTQNYPTQIREMFMWIYWQAWQTLSENGRALLKAMPLTREPADVDYLLAISGLSENAIWPAIEELRQRSLLEVEGDLHEKRYGIRHLTDTFLRSEIILAQRPAKTMQPDDGQKETDANFIKSIRAKLHYGPEKTETMQVTQVALLDGQRFSLNEELVQDLRQPERWQDAASLLLQTFDFSEWRDSWHEWTAVFEQALAAAPEKETEVYGRLQNRLGQLYLLGSRLPEAEAQHQAALTLAQRLANDDLLAITYNCLAEYHLNQRDVDQTRAFAQAALDLAQTRSSLERIAAFAQRNLGRIEAYVGNWPAAIDHYQQAIQSWVKLNNHTFVARSLADLGNVYIKTDKFDLARQAFEEAGVILTPTQNVKDKAFVSLNLGVLYYRQKNWARAEAAFLEIDPVALREQNELDLLATVYNNLGNVNLELKRWDSAADYLNLAIELFRERENQLDLGNSLGTLASVYGQDGKQEAALPLYAEAIQLLQQFPESQWAQKLLREFETANEKLLEA